MNGTVRADDGTLLAYRVLGDGPALLCLPGGPMQDADYLGDLGGLSAHRRLVLLDPRGTGRSGTPADPTSYRCDRLVGDVERVREHLGLERVDVLAHSAGANLAALHAAAHPDRVGRLVLVTPSVLALGIDVPDDVRRDLARSRRDEPWFADASPALEAAMAGEGDPGTADRIAPFLAGRWDDAARAHHAAQRGRRNDEAAAAYGGAGVFDVDRTRAAVRALPAPVLALAGGVDVAAPPAAVAEVAEAYGRGRLVVQPGAGHAPWLDDPTAFVCAVEGFLATP
ncbi:alpha/beta hydrolase fold protein [Cellulomonas flavigena DSM 20109]|uniref:Alpha/beta hydrolase fold protein n=1 Tax=Cellulomonas flavigena (strain ATCC 482 / DSM 20109 / BCRC 11376 / JCM 18109 / NBRC 3775 / NCIMB 8073 / NRS 134) TaxID=446466 RepID=D5UDC3_CELFN|nr:alpha/beta hydrolase [Cellulomonas flavigena]ADG76379.1 alpha/beta hydrolase fold protein [Cellulomonas flavigena DSM 20109]